jgi:hypothetical protein
MQDYQELGKSITTVHTYGCIHVWLCCELCLATGMCYVLVTDESAGLSRS